MYDALMKKIQLGRSYPITGPRLRTKKDIHGNRYEFDATHIRVMDRKTVRVMGQDQYEAWCRVDFKFNSVPKWLKEELKGLM